MQFSISQPFAQSETPNSFAKLHLRSRHLPCDYALSSSPISYCSAAAAVAVCASVAVVAPAVVGVVGVVPVVVVYVYAADAAAFAALC